MLGLLLQISAPTIFVTFVDANQQPIVGRRVYFQNEAGNLFGNCVTGAAGTCAIQVGGLDGAGFSAKSPAPLIRGQLTVQPHGVRPIIWPADEDVAITIELDIEGHVNIPIHADHAHEHTIEPTATAVLFATRTPLPTAVVTEAVPQREAGDMDADFSAENEPLTTTSDAIPQPLWPMILCSSVFALLWGVAVVILYRRQAR